MDEEKAPEPKTEENLIVRAIHNFFLPKLNRNFFLRLVLLIVVAVIVFKYLLIPCIISGASMEPTVHSQGFTFCWCGRYWNSEPRRGDIVIIRYDRGVFFLKRIVGLPGEVVAFQDGCLYINGFPMEEPYVKYPCNWQMDPVRVGDDEYYVVGDNRSMPFSQHQKGAVRASRIAGSPLF